MLLEVHFYSMEAMPPWITSPAAVIIDQNTCWQYIKEVHNGVLSVWGTMCWETILNVCDSWLLMLKKLSQINMKQNNWDTAVRADFPFLFSFNFNRQRPHVTNSLMLTCFQWFQIQYNPFYKFFIMLLFVSCFDTAVRSASSSLDNPNNFHQEFCSARNPSKRNITTKIITMTTF